MRYIIEGLHTLAIRYHPSNVKDYQQGVKSLKERICKNIYNDRNFRKLYI